MIYQFFKKRDSIKNESQKKQRGRSMVEMLGVLAIIGVLSIGGIQGYTIAMRRYKANEILQVVNKYALLEYTKIHNLMLNDSQKYYMDEDGIWLANGGGVSSYNIITPFSNAGLGGLPSGLKSIYYHGIATNNSGDILTLILELEDQQLCQTVFNLAGTKDEYGIRNCKNGGDLTKARVSFIAN